MCGWQVKLSLTRANLSALEMSITHVMKHYTDVLFTYFPVAEYQDQDVCMCMASSKIIQHDKTHIFVTRMFIISM